VNRRTWNISQNMSSTCRTPSRDNYIAAGIVLNCVVAVSPATSALRSSRKHQDPEHHGQLGFKVLGCSGGRLFPLSTFRGEASRFMHDVTNKTVAAPMWGVSNSRSQVRFARWLSDLNGLHFASHRVCALSEVRHIWEYPPKSHRAHRLQLVEFKTKWFEAVRADQHPDRTEIFMCW